MEFSIMKRAEKFLRKQGKKYGKAAAVVLAAAVAVATVAALSMPARTLEKETYCGLEEHTHTQECYEKVLTCTKGTDGEAALECTLHQHTKDCYKDKDTKKELICGYADYAVHQHDKNCYIDGKLVCKLKELKEHKHTDKCYKEEKTLVCKEKESDGHEHSDKCYEEKKELTCGKEESEGHKHSDDCYDEEGNLICGKEESEGHKHSDDCYKVTKELTCGKEESEGHKHSDECYETKKVLKCDKPEIILHQHTQECFNKNPDKNHKHTDECKNADGVYVCGGLKCDKIDVRKHQHSDDEIVKPDASHEHTDECYEEQLVCGKEEHVHTDECYVEPEEKEAEETEAHVMTAEGDGYTVTVTYGDDAEIPENAELTVKEFEEGSEEYAKRYEELTQSINAIDEDPDAETGDADETTEKKLSSLRLFDVAFMADGEEIEPKASVDVKFAFDGEDSLDDSSVVHFGTEKTELLSGDSLKKETSEDGKPTLGFSVDSFSNIGIFDVEEGSQQTNYLQGEKYNIKNINNASDYNFKHKKEIDYLGDNDGSTDQDNSDTSLDNNNSDQGKTNTEDKYRLYLDMEGKSEPANVLFIIDRSSSMNIEMKGKRRDMALSELLMGTSGNKGIIEQFLARNADKTSKSDKSYMAAVWFGGDYNNTGEHYKMEHYINAEGRDIGANKEGLDPTIVGMYEGPYTMDAGPVFSWTDTYSSGLLKCTQGTTSRGEHEIGALPKVEGTNYCAGLMAASAMLKGVPNDNKTIVIFLSDGLPTYFYQANSFVEDGATGNIKRYGEALEDKSQVCAEGLRARDKVGGVNYGKTVAPQYGFFNQTRGFYEKFKAAHPDVRFFTVGIGVGGTLELRQDNNYNRNGGNYLTAEERSKRKAYPRSYSVMEAMGEGGMKEGNSASQLESTLKEIIFPSNVVITDNLSKYVDFYKDQPDVLVTATHKIDGTKIELWKGGSNGDGTYGTAQNGNKINGVGPVVKAVRVDGKKVTLEFEPNYALGGDYIYTLSFNVQVTDEAFDEFAEKGNYSGVTGDSGTSANQPGEDTDYSGNKTSSGQPGFHSNSSAEVTYKVDGTDGKKEYDHPVVQVWDSKLKLIKKNGAGELLAGVEFTLKRGDEKVDTYTTDKNGEVLIPANVLKTGSYTLTESKPLSGYDGISEGIQFKVKKGRIIPESTDEKANYEEGKGAWSWVVDNNSSKADQTYLYELNITNALDAVLPETGGMGTVLYTTAGLGLILAAGFIYLVSMKRRKTPVEKNN